MADIEDKLVSLFVGIILTASLLPTAINTIVSTDTTSWGANLTNIWDVLPVIALIGVFLMYLKTARG